MKKLISLILCLLLCFTFIVSCENEEAPSSSSSEESSTSEVPSVQPPKFPSMIENAYTTYTVDTISNSFGGEHLWRNNGPSYKNWLFKDFNSYIEFFNTYATDRWSEGSFLPEQITADTFKDYVILAVVFQHNNYVSERKYGCLCGYVMIGSPSSRDEYLLVAEELAIYNSKWIETAMPPYKIDLVLIPRSDITGNDINAVDVLMYSNSYETFSSDTSSFVICIKAERD